MPLIPPHLGLAIDAGVAMVTLDRPEKKNAVSAAMWRGISELFEGLGSDDAVRAIVLTGAGGNFCAGADIAEFDTVRADVGTARDYEALNSSAFAAVRHAPVAVIAAISGICFGGGFGLAAASDIRIGEHGARFSVPAAKLGLAYPHDAMADIVQALGPQRTRYMAYTAESIDAEAALAAGFLLELVDTGTALPRAMEIATRIAGNAPLSVKASKASIAATLAGDETATARAKALGDATFDSLDYDEGRAAFKARRVPLFTGR